MYVFLCACIEKKKRHQTSNKLNYSLKYFSSVVEIPRLYRNVSERAILIRIHCSNSFDTRLIFSIDAFCLFVCFGFIILDDLLHFALDFTAHVKVR